MSSVYGLTVIHSARTGQHHFLCILCALQMVRALFKIRPSESTVRNLGARLRARTHSSLHALRRIQDEQNGGTQDSEDRYDLHDDDYNHNYETDDCDGEEEGV